ncbi:MAG: hypothetical protein GWM87_10370, partial [Xanthomonadales bacterium]|nr:fasciclin domain-containing protein [Xanthomonadales bacterium]NIX13293.1 hypothetical protein [Xanthomonadales bacterium]
LISGAAMAQGKSPGGDTIYDIASADPDNFSVLVSILDATGLDAVLDAPGQYTVFAPTNGAFVDLINALVAAVGEEATNALLSDTDFLTAVLLYHVTDGRRFSNSVFNRNNMKDIETLLEGHYIYAKPNLTIMDESSLTADAPIVAPLFDLSASNGVIHVIGAVLVPGE